MTSHIVVLDSSIAMKIAAGEVIERPASAVRELLDNSLDADATWISIDVENGGKSYISVLDNGNGMNKADIKKSYLNHATSKIKNFEDLLNLKTFGFRGEALASLAEISKLQIASKYREEEFGNELTIKFGQIEDLVPKALNQGTKITITNFFQNVPARLKFLSSDTSEYRAIIQEVIKKALAKPSVGFELSHNGEKKYQLNAVHELHDRIINIFTELKDVLHGFSYEEQGIKIYGFLSKPSWYKPSRSYQYLFVNGKAIEWQAFKQQISIAYNNLLPPSRFPAVFCYIDIDTEKIDFNVHPQKKEIRFDNEKLVSDIIRRAIRKGVENSSFIFNNNIENKKTSIDASLSYGQNFTNNRIKNTFSNAPSSTYKINLVNNKIPTHQQLKDLFISTQDVKQQENNIFDLLENSRYISMIFKTYLLFEGYNMLYLIDFHAMHERIRYEQLLAQNNIKSQMILPFIFQISEHEADLFEQIEPNLLKLGFQITRISNDSFSVEALPYIVSINNAENVIREFFIEEFSIQNSFVWDRMCKTIACKGSSRAGDSLVKEEIDMLIQEWKTCLNPHSCPHGRPIVLPMNKVFFDKEFKRTGF